MAAVHVDVRAADGFGELATKGKYCPQNVLVDVEQDTAAEDGLITRELTEIHNDRVKSVGDFAFWLNDVVTTVELPSVVTIGDSAFSDCDGLTNIALPMCRAVRSSFGGCTKLRKVDLPQVEELSADAFYFCLQLTTLILRNNKVCRMSHTDGLADTPIAKGRGYIYVPKALLESYKTATNWSMYASQFRAIEDYPDVVREPANLMSDVDFEAETVRETPAGWNPATLPAGKKQGGVVSREAAYAGSHGLLLTGSKVGATYNYIEVGDGVTVYLEAMAKSAEDSVDLSVIWHSRWEKNNWGFTPGQYGTEYTTERVGTEWTKISGTYTMPEPTASGLKYSYFAFRFELPKEGGTVYIDDVKLYVMPKNPAARIGSFAYATLNEALAAVREGDTLTICAGKHPCRGVVTAGTYKDVTIAGEPGAAIPGLSFNVDLENVTIRDITFTGERIGIAANRNTNGLTIENCTFRNRNRAIHAYDLDAKQEIYTYQDLTVRNCLFNQRGVMANGEIGSAVFCPSIHGLVVTDCTFSRVPINGIQAGIRVTGDVTITGNVFEQCGNINVNIPGLKDGYEGKLVIEGNTFVTPDAPGEIGNYVSLGTAMDIGKNYGDTDPDKPESFYYAVKEEQA